MCILITNINTMALLMSCGEPYFNGGVMIGELIVLLPINSTLSTVFKMYTQLLVFSSGDIYIDIYNRTQLITLSIPKRVTRQRLHTPLLHCTHASHHLHIKIISLIENSLNK